MAGTRRIVTSCWKYILVILFNAGGWFNFMSVVVEEPLLVFYLPESWRLPSIVRVADTITLVVFAIYVIWRHHHGSPDLEWRLVYCILAVGTVACLMEAFIWDIMTTVNGRQTSLAFLILVGFICLVNNMSAVVFLPYMARVQKVYLSAFYTGEGLASLTPALLAIGQGVGKSHCVNTTMTMMEGNVSYSTQDYRRYTRWGTSLLSEDLLPHCIRSHTGIHRCLLFATFQCGGEL